MGIFQALNKHHAEVVDAWVYELHHDESSRYFYESDANLRPLVCQATEAFCLVIEGGAWDDLDKFITFIARKRLSQGFKLSEVQKAFMLYQQVATPILIRELPKLELSEALLHLAKCTSQTVGRFSDFFQGLHEEYMREQTVVLEREVEKRTRELSESESKYKALVEDIRDGYYVIHMGIIVYANNAFCSMHGKSMHEMVGSPFLNLVANESKEEVVSSYNQHQSQHPSSLLEYLRVHKDGRKLPTETLAKSSIYGGKPAILGVCRDISERRALEIKTREAETLNALAQQAASLAHDIRNPLTAIKMNVQMLAVELNDNPTHYRLIEISLKEVASIELSLEEMMNLARPFRLNREIVQLRPFIMDCVESLRARMVHKEVSAAIKLDPNLEQLRIDPRRMEQTLVNLLFNAIEAVPKGGKIYVSSGQKELLGRHWAMIYVADNGPGIPKELLPHLFDEKPNRRIGLGLDNVKKVVVAHGGAVEANLRRPRGLRVSIRLPLEQ